MFKERVNLCYVWGLMPSDKRVFQIKFLISQQNIPCGYSRVESIEDIQIFGMNMPQISSSEAKNAYFMSGEATNEIYIFSLKISVIKIQAWQFDENPALQN